MIAVAIASAGAACVLYLFLIAPGTRAPGQESARQFLGRGLFAHRGLHDMSGDLPIPENSLAAFQAARDAGYGVELDLNLTRDGEVVVFHDETLDRVCGVPGGVAELDWSQLKGKTLCGTDQTIPLFSHVLDLAGGTVPLIVELKNTPRYHALCRAAAALLDTYPGPYCIESFHPAIVRWFRLNRPEVIRGQLSAGPGEFTDQSRPVRHVLSSLLANIAGRPHFVAYRYQDAQRKTGGGGSPGLLRRLRIFRAMGGALVAWTVTDEADSVTKRWCSHTFDTIIFEGYTP